MQLCKVTHIHLEKYWCSVKYTCPVFKSGTLAQFSSVAHLCDFVVLFFSEVHSPLKYKAVIFLALVEYFIYEAEEMRDISTFSHLQRGSLMFIKMLFKGLFSGLLKNIFHPSQFILSLMFSLHLLSAIRPHQLPLPFCLKKKEVSG